jgi:FAD/FMN-containing dehydrogenase
MRIENYGRTWSFTADRVAKPSNVDELQRVVREARGVRVMGARHSWSQGIVTEDTLVSLDAMKRVMHVDRDALRVRVEAGIRLEELIAELERHDLALENLGSIAKQSLAGAISTGTHGTGLGFKCLADQVQSLSLVDGRGERRVVDREHPDFPAVVVGLGAFGVVYEMTLSVVPAFQMHFITEMMPFDELIDDLDHHVRERDHFKFWWLVGDDQVVVFRQRHTNEARNDSDLTRWLNDEVIAVGAYRFLLALQRVRRDPLVNWTNHVISRSYAGRQERICKSHVAFLTPEPPVHRESEWAFDYADAPALLRSYRDLLLQSGHSFNFIQEIRFTAADEFWASPSYGRDSIWLSLYNIDDEARWDDQRRRFLAFAEQNGGRPHWGKEAHFDHESLSTCFPRLADFANLRRTYDPENRFANRWLRQVLGLSASRTR